VLLQTDLVAAGPAAPRGNRVGPAAKAYAKAKAAGKGARKGKVAPGPAMALQALDEAVSSRVAHASAELAPRIALSDAGAPPAWDRVSAALATRAHESDAALVAVASRGRVELNALRTARADHTRRIVQAPARGEGERAVAHDELSEAMADRSYFRRLRKAAS